MINELYTLLFVISLFALLVLILKFNRKNVNYYTLLFACINLAIFGYMQLSDAKDIQAALYANQVIYLGASFAPFLLFMCLADLCKVKIPVFIQLAGFFYGVVVFTLTSTIGVVDWYYKSVSIEEYNGVSVLVKEYGPLHKMYPIFLGLMVLGGIGVVVYSLWKKNEVSAITSMLLLCTMVIMVLIYGLEKVFALKYSYIPLAYVISQLIVLFLLFRISLYDVVAVSADSMAEDNSSGFVIFDSKGKYLGADSTAKAWFPELAGVALDRTIRNENTAFLTQLGKWAREEDDQTEYIFGCEDKFIEARHSIIKERKSKRVHCIYLNDVTEQQKYTKLIEEYNDNLAHDVEEKTEKIRQIQNDITISMASIVENRDSNTGGHIERTSQVVKIFINHLLETDLYPNLTDKIARRITKAAPLHDFGKIGVPDEILNKPGKFEPEEYEIMKTHSAKGAVIVERILKNSDDEMFRNIAVNVAHFHHEKWDGNGYPNHLSGEDIPFEARVMALADVFDALVSKRVYKDEYSYDKAFSIIEESGGSHFDPKLCLEFLKCRPQIEELYNNKE